MGQGESVGKLLSEFFSLGEVEKMHFIATEGKNSILSEGEPD